MMTQPPEAHELGMKDKIWQHGKVDTTKLMVLILRIVTIKYPLDHLNLKGPVEHQERELFIHTSPV